MVTHLEKEGGWVSIHVELAGQDMFVILGTWNGVRWFIIVRSDHHQPFNYIPLFGIISREIKFQFFKFTTDASAQTVGPATNSKPTS